MSIVLYRRYRPKYFSEVSGQEHITKILQSAIIYNKIAHAYIFIGPRGTGKTTIARILAKSINCLNPEKGEPCNKCQACESINQGKALDLVEIDAASNRGIDDIRALKENIGFSPTYFKFKVFIIDEVHMLTKEAFNALLKTLEEPPEHAIFILATTEVHKVPETIISRCQRFDFRKLSLDEIKKRLFEISKKEGIAIEEGAADLIALNAGGALRDAESILGLIMSMEDKNITTKEAQMVLGTPEVSAAVNFVKLIGKKDAAEAISYVNRLNMDGYDLEQFARTLVEYLRNTLLLKINAKLKNLIEAKLTREQLDEMIGIGKFFTEKELLKMLRIFIDVQNELKSSILIQLPLELAVVEILGNYNFHETDSLEDTESEKKPIPKISVNKDISVDNKVKTGNIIDKSESHFYPEANEGKKISGNFRDKKADEALKIDKEGDGDALTSKKNVLEKWPFVLGELKNHNNSISAFLKSCVIIDVKANQIILSTPYNFHKEKLEESKSRNIINEVLDKIVGAGNLHFKIVLEKDLKKMGYRLPEKNKKMDDTEAAVLNILGGEVVK